MKLLLPALLLLASPAFAGVLKVTENDPIQIRTVRIQAINVKGVVVQLKTEAERTSCNKLNLSAKAAHIDGNQFNWWSYFYVTTSMSETEMYCPLPTPVKETVESNKFVFESYSNKNLKDEIDITLAVPAQFEVLVEELK